MKKLLRLILGLVVLYLLVRLCTNNMGSIIQLPGGTESSSTEDSGGGWLSPKNKDNGGDKTLKDISEELEKTLGIGKNKGSQTGSGTTSQSTTGTNGQSTTGSSSSSTGTSTSSASNPLSFKGIPITGSLSSFGNELVKAGFRNSGNGTYTGDFAGYSGCKVTPEGNNPVKEVRVDFPVITDWNTLEKAYDDLQASLTRKYGVEPRMIDGSNLAVYDLPNGNIYLDADVKEQSSWHVILRYSNFSPSGIVTTSGGNPIDDL